MPEKYVMDARFEAYAAFWEPATPDNKFTGRLARDDDDIYLITSPRLNPIDTFQDFFGA